MIRPSFYGRCNAKVSVPEWKQALHRRAQRENGFPGLLSASGKPRPTTEIAFVRAYCFGAPSAGIGASAPASPFGAMAAGVGGPGLSTTGVAA
jgi:hypothetical protein